VQTMPLTSGIHLSERYEILSPLGAGGMGEVYRARDLRLDRDVAIKVLPEHLAKNPDALSRFEREGKALAALSHANILTIYDFGSDKGINFAVMELLKGETLRARLVHSKPPWNIALKIGAEVSEGLAAAHSAGVIHRDLKPENIFLTVDGGVKILDFGLARREGIQSQGEQNLVATISRTEPGTVMGTVPYMSPEQVRGLSLDARSDLFSFGSILYEMLAGNCAFSRKTPADTISAILNENLDSISESNKIPKELDQIVNHCLEKNPEHRFQTARDLAFDLKALLSGSQISKPYRNPRTFFPRTAVWSATILILLLIAFSFHHYLPRGKAISSLAILPFANVGSDPDAEYLSDGITESIISSLSQLPKMRVMAHDTVFSYKGQHVDPRKVGHDMKVEAVVTGAVMQKGDTLVIRANLINVADGTELWGEQYARKLTDLLSVQQEISGQISNNLQLKLTGEEKKSVSKQYPKNSEAYQLYLTGRYYWHKETPEGYEKSIQYFEQALQKDPNYALAYAGLANTYDVMTYEGILPPEEGFQKAVAAARKALEIDDTVAEAYTVLGTVSVYESNEQASEMAYKRAIALNPNETTARRYYSQSLMRLGRKDEAIEEMKRALEIDPLSLEINKSLGATLFWAKQYDPAIEQLRKTVDLDPNYAPAHDLLADAYSRKGMFKEAIAEEQKYLSLSGDKDGAEALGRDYAKFGYKKAMQNLYSKNLDILKENEKERYVSPISFAIIYALLDQKDEAFAWLEKAYQERSPWMVMLPTDQQFDNLRSDPRFAELTRRIRLSKVKSQF
jgi:serine/threonine protein kinase/Flp pilus assembly protein TadD